MNIEKYNWHSHKAPIIGVDEVGRGCLAGNVFAAAAVLNEEKPYKHYTDSKKLSEKQRILYSEQIIADHRVSIAFASVDEIFEINILKASLLAMRRAVLGLNLKQGTILVDGKFPIPDLPHFEQVCLVKGDLRAEPVAAASIAAKVARDTELVKMAETYPGYGLEKHKGYGTPFHKEAIKKLGPTPQHRKAFAGVKEFL